jgi:DNA-binding NtrC family response regulator
VCHAKKQREYRADVREKGIDHRGIYAEAVRGAKRRILLRAIREEGGNLTAAAISLGVHRNTVNRIMREAGLSAIEIKRYLKVVAA